MNARSLWALIQDKTLSRKLVRIDIHVNTLSNLTEGISQKTSCHQSNPEETTQFKMNEEPCPQSMHQRACTFLQKGMLNIQQEKIHRKPIKIFSTNRVDCNTKDYESGVGGAEKKILTMNLPSGKSRIGHIRNKVVLFLGQRWQMSSVS